jgi:hypothetical protein
MSSVRKDLSWDTSACISHANTLHFIKFWFVQRTAICIRHTLTIGAPHLHRFQVYPKVKYEATLGSGVQKTPTMENWKSSANFVVAGVLQRNDQRIRWWECMSQAIIWLLRQKIGPRATFSDVSDILSPSRQIFFRLWTRMNCTKIFLKVDPGIQRQQIAWIERYSVL